MTLEFFWGRELFCSIKVFFGSSPGYKEPSGQKAQTFTIEGPEGDNAGNFVLFPKANPGEGEARGYKQRGTRSKHGSLKGQPEDSPGCAVTDRPQRLPRLSEVYRKHVSSLPHTVSKVYFWKQERRLGFMSRRQRAWWRQSAEAEKPRAHWSPLGTHSAPELHAHLIQFSRLATAGEPFLFCLARKPKAGHAQMGRRMPFGGNWTC